MMPPMSNPRVGVVTGLIWSTFVCLTLHDSSTMFLIDFGLYMAGWYLYDILKLRKSRKKIEEP